MRTQRCVHTLSKLLFASCLAGVILLWGGVSPVLAFSADEPATYTIKLDGAGEEIAYHSATDEEGNLFIVGSYTSTVEGKLEVYRDDDGADPRTSSAELVLPASAGGFDLFVAKFSALGVPVWVKTLGGEGDDAATGVVYDRVTAKVFVAGYVTGSVTGVLGPHVATDSPDVDVESTTNLFIAQVNADGNWAHYETMPLLKAASSPAISGLSILSGDNRTTSPLHLQGHSLALAYDMSATSGSPVALYIKGEISNPASAAGAKIGVIAGTNFDVSATAGRWAFVSKVVYRENPQQIAGEKRWTWEWMMPVSTARTAMNSTSITQLAVDAAQGLNSPVFLTGYWSGVLNDGGGNSIAAQGAHSGYVGKLQSNNGQRNFMVTVGGDSMVNAIAVNADGDLMVAGGVAAADAAQTSVAFRSAGGAMTVSVGPEWQAHPLLSPRYKHQAVIAKLNAGGVWQWATLLDGLYSSALDLQVGASGEYYLTGGVGKDTSFNGIPDRFADLSPGTLSVNNAITSVSFPALNALYAVTSPNQATADGVNFPSPSWHDATLTCPAGKTLIGNKCYADCPATYTASADRCVRAANSYSTGTNASCGSGYELITSYCYDTCDPDAPANWNNTLCWDGESSYPRDSVCPGQESGGTCYPVCNSGYTRSGPTCSIAQSDIARSFTIASAGCTPNYNCSIAIDNSSIQIELIRNGTVFGSAMIDSRLRSKADYTSSVQRDLADYLDADLSPDPKNIPAQSVDGAGSELMWNDSWQLRFAHNGTDSDADYLLQGQWDITFNLEDSVHSANHTSIDLTGLMVNRNTGAITRALTFPPDFIEPELVPDSYAYVARFRELNSAAHFDWVEASDSKDTYGGLLVLGNLQTLYLFGGRGHYPNMSPELDTADYAHRNSTGPDTLQSTGTIMNVVNPETGAFLPTFLNYFDFVVGNRVLPPVNGLETDTVVGLRHTVGAISIIGTSGVGQKELLQALKDSVLYAAAPLTHAIVLWPSQNSPAMSAQPFYGKAIRVRWPTVEEGLQEYLYSTDAVETLPPQIMNPAGAAKHFFWIQYAQKVSDGTKTSTGISYSADTLVTTAERMAALVFFDDADPTLSDPTILSVRSYNWKNVTRHASDVVAPIGTTLQPPNQITAPKSGYVMTELARYDANPLVYDRASHTGQITPVNSNGSDPDQQLVVTWYEAGQFGLDWPARSASYLPQWPATSDQIVVASQKGSAGLDDQGAAQSTEGFNVALNQPKLYVQNNRAMPGFNPNEEHALLYQASGSDFVIAYALRTDLNNLNAITSDPYVLVRYLDPALQLWRYRVFPVYVTHEPYTSFAMTPATAGNAVTAPYPLNLPGLVSTDTVGSGSAYWLDKNGQVWARSNGAASLTVDYHYHLLDDFWYDTDGNGTEDNVTDVEWKDASGNQITLVIDSEWPSYVPEIVIGDTLIDARNGLPGVRNMRDLLVVYDENDPIDINNPATAARAVNASVRLFDFSAPVDADLPATVTGVQFTGTALTLQGANPVTIPARLDVDTGHYYFPDLPSDLRYRLRFNPFFGTFGRFYFQGGDFNAETGQPVSAGDAVMQLTNVMTGRDLDQIQIIDNAVNSIWDSALATLYFKTRNPNAVDTDNSGSADHSLLLGFISQDNNNKNLLRHAIVNGEAALSAAFAKKEGYVVLAENAVDDPDNTSPANLHVIKVVAPKADGSLHVIRNADNALDPRLVVRQDLDFAGKADELTFEWWWLADTNGEPDVQIDPDTGTPVSPTGTWQKIADSQGLNALTLTSGLPVLADGWVISRYRGLKTDADPDGELWSGFSGYKSIVASEIHAVATSGWVRRVMAGINQFRQRYDDFYDNEVDTYSSMLVQAGKGYEGDVALNAESGNLNQVGLIELYQTVLNRALGLSIDASNPIVNEAAVNKQLLLAASRIADFYLLLGNEAYSDAMDPTVGVQTNNGGIGYLAPTLFAFKDQQASLLDEELALLRGVDHTYSAPVYNRLPWNFSSGADGEATYVQVYGIPDTGGDGALNDARSLYPQGHGDAWGYYLTATKQFYALARHPNYDWQPLTDTTSIAGINVQVDYKDEERFARAAAAKARTGARIVDLTFRAQYTHSPAGQWQGYKDTDSNRAWGMDEWARRAGQGAVLDWALGNALLPYEDDTAVDGVARIDRQTVAQLAEIPAALVEIDSIVTRADSGSNPFGLDTNTIAFDIDPLALANGDTHFDQIYARALKASTNALKLFDYANDLSQRIRSNQLTSTDLQRQVEQQEQDYRSRLIEMFGYPYAGEMGAGKLYPADYNGADLYHYMYIDSPLNPLPASGMETLVSEFNSFIESTVAIDQNGNHSGVQATGSFLFPEDVTDPDNPAYFNVSDAAQLTVSFPYSNKADYVFTAPTDWGIRRAPGRIQQQLGEIQLIQARTNTANAEHSALLGKIRDHMTLIEEIYAIRSEQIEVFDTATNEYHSAVETATQAERTGDILKEVAESYFRFTNALKTFFPTVLGFASDVTSSARGAVLMGGAVGSQVVLGVGGAIARSVGIPSRVNADTINYSGRYVLTKTNYPIEIVKELTVLEDLMRDELIKRAQIVQLEQETANALGLYQQLVAEGMRIISQRELFRREIAGRTTDQRYQDLTFRVFRNDALQKYRASFDMAARYTYLAAKAFDYETGLLSDDSSDQRFYEELVRQRTLGYFAGGTTPVEGVEGLSTPLARMRSTFDSVKSSYGFYSPLNEQMAFSLRREAMRIGFSPAATTQSVWQEKLQSSRVSDLWQVPEFRRFCRPPRAESAGPIPGMVLRFSTMIDFGRNLFGWPLGPGDFAYDSSRAATKFRTVGLHFDGYPQALLSASPRAYLVPAGADILRSPSQTGALREYRVLDQTIPVPTNLVQGSTTYQSEGWIPENDSVSESWTNLRRFSQLPVDTNTVLDFNSVRTDTRLIGRSVWNTDWLLIIPGSGLLADGNQGIDRLINGEPGTTGISGISDIRLYFDTYSTSGE